jgi:hypothetical protein
MFLTPQQEIQSSSIYWNESHQPKLKKKKRERKEEEEEKWAYEQKLNLIQIRSKWVLPLSTILAVALPGTLAYPITDTDVNYRSGPGPSLLLRHQSLHQIHRRQTKMPNLRWIHLRQLSLWQDHRPLLYHWLLVRTGTSSYIISATAHSSGGSGSTGKGPAIIKAAEKELGLPYVWRAVAARVRLVVLSIPRVWLIIRFVGR